MLKNSYVQKVTLVDNELVLDTTLSNSALGLYNRLIYFSNTKSKFRLSEMSYDFNLDYSELQEALNALIERNYIKCNTDEQGNTTFEIINLNKTVDKTKTVELFEDIKSKNIEELIEYVIKHYSNNFTETNDSYKIELKRLLNKGYDYIISHKEFLKFKKDLVLSDMIHSDMISVTEILNGTLFYIKLTCNSVSGSFSSVIPTTDKFHGNLNKVPFTYNIRTQITTMLNILNNKKYKY